MKWNISLCGLVIGMGFAACVAAEKSAKPSLKDELAQLKTPPEWFGTTQTQWDVNRPWKEGRIEIRRLLALSDNEVRQAVKLTWLYAQKNDIGDGHELPMYLFMSGNYAWATIEFPKYLKTVEGKGPTHAYLSYASCLAHFGEYTRALEVCEKALADLPTNQWRINSTANIRGHMGDICAEMGEVDKAKQYYAEAIKLFPTSQQPYGRHLLPRRVAQIQAKLDMLTMASLADAKLRDGTYKANALGYAEKKELGVSMTIRGGKIADVKVEHEEKIDLNATKIIPTRIIEQQSLKVDIVTGATVTSQGIIDGAFKALKQAGLQ